MQATPGDPVVEKYISMGLGREAVSFAVLNYGDNPIKACSFPLVYLLLQQYCLSASSITKTTLLLTQNVCPRSFE
jgi:hypothetical protein